MTNTISNLCIRLGLRGQYKTPRNQEFNEYTCIDYSRGPTKKILKIQRGNMNQYIEEQTTQWQKKYVQEDKQLYTKYTHKTKDRIKRTPLKTGG